MLTHWSLSFLYYPIDMSTYHFVTTCMGQAWWNKTNIPQKPSWFMHTLLRALTPGDRNAMWLPEPYPGCHHTWNKQRVLMHGHQGWNVRHGLCHIYRIYVCIWVVYSFCLFCCLFIIVTTQFVALYEPCKPKPKPKPSTYDTRTTTPWQRSKFPYLDRSQSNKYAINMQIQTISVSK